MKLNRGQVMQEDKDQKHRSKSTTSTTEWLIHLKKKNALWSGPARLNLIHIRHPNNIAEQTQFLEEWCEIPPDRCINLMCNYRKRLMEVIAAKGGSTS